jgi:adenylosuccinate synthase
MHKADLVMDFQYGSTGKGLIAGWLAKREKYDTAVCSFATNAGHTYIDKARGIHVMTQQLPTGITSETVEQVLLGPGSLIHIPTLMKEIHLYERHLRNKKLIIHPHAAIVYDDHAATEVANGQTKMGSTAKGVGAAMIERIQRGASGRLNVAYMEPQLKEWVVTQEEYRAALEESESILIEGAQGFSLSLYHGFYPYTTSRDVTPWQIAADCGLPFKWASRINMIGTMRTFPIRVSNRDGSSGPGYPDQNEITWDQIGVEPELTTVTKLPRRLFTFSQEQMRAALFHCGHYWKTDVFLNFANYMPREEVAKLVEQIEKFEVRGTVPTLGAKVKWIGLGPDDADVLQLRGTTE